MNKHWILKVAALVAVLAYWFVSLDHLAVFPPVGQDEPWIAAAPYKLATQGVYGSDLFAGYYGVERHNYQHPPLYPLILAGVFKLAGIGVFQMRFLPVACGLLILALVFAIGRQAGNHRVGTLAVVLLMTLRLAGGQDVTGVPLLDFARINRYDIAVPLFGLMAFWVFNRAERGRSGWWYVLPGVSIGLSSLSHLYGAFWLPALLAVLLYRRGRRLFLQAEPYLMVAGFGLTWLPWVAYIATGWYDYVGQMQFVAARLDVFDPRFYLSNLLHEIDRYRPIDVFDPDGRLRLTRPGTWTGVLGLPVALGLMLWRGRHSAHDETFALGATLVIQVLMFALFLKVKFYNYGIALWPLVILALAWLGIWLWDWKDIRLLRGALLALLVFILAEGGLRMAHRRTVAAQASSYDHFEAQVAGYIPPGSRVLGLQHYWLGLRQYPYRTWLLPILKADPRYYHESLTLDQALIRVDPDVVLLDRHMGDYFDSLADPTHPDHAQYVEFWGFMDQHRAQLAGVVEDPTYGTMRVYRLNGEAH